MTMRFTVLASGSSGNSSLLESDGFGLLVDIGLGPRKLATRLKSFDRSWRHIQAVVLTHTHTDHWSHSTLRVLYANGIPLYCHEAHLDHLRTAGGEAHFEKLAATKLIRTYRAERELVFAGRVQCRPLAVRHDGGPTFGFHFSGQADLFGPAWSLGYAADLGTWDTGLVDSLGDVDLLALEFNHDVAMQRSSGRHPQLIRRVLGDEGHLSNEQAAELFRTLLQRSASPRLKTLVQLHLSRQCNHPRLAHRAAKRVVEELGLPIAIHTASQDVSSPTFAHPPEFAKSSVASPALGAESQPGQSALAIDHALAAEPH